VVIPLLTPLQIALSQYKKEDCGEYDFNLGIFCGENCIPQAFRTKKLNGREKLIY
jgi:hypothetical protein